MGPQPITRLFFAWRYPSLFFYGFLTIVVYGLEMKWLFSKVNICSTGAR